MAHGTSIGWMSISDQPLSSRIRRTRSLVREGELARLVRSAGGEVRQERRGGALGRRHERILRRAPPRDEAELGAVPCGAAQVREGRDRVVEEHHAEARDDRVEARPARTAYVCASATMKLAEAPSRSARARAAAIIGSEMSMPVQLPRAPRRRATATVVPPVPQPTSSTRPGRPGRDGVHEQVLDRLEHLVEQLLRSTQARPPDPFQSAVWSVSFWRLVIHRHGHQSSWPTEGPWSGRSTTNDAPCPTWLSTPMVPPCASTITRAIHSPGRSRRSAGPARSARSARTGGRGVRASMPGPRSVTTMRALPLVRVDHDVDGLAGAVLDGVRQKVRHHLLDADPVPARGRAARGPRPGSGCPPSRPAP